MNKRLRIFAPTIFLLIAVAMFVACASSDPYEPPASGRRPAGEGRGGFRGTAGGDGMQGGLDGLPPGSWWRDAQISGAVNLTSGQVAALDKIESGQGEEITRLVRDSQVAVRQLRDALDADPAMSDDIVAAGQRIRSMRDDILDRQVRMLAAERLVLSHQQWTALQNALQSLRSERMQDRRGASPRGRGGWGGGMGGRRPGGFGG